MAMPEEEKVAMPIERRGEEPMVGISPESVPDIENGASPEVGREKTEERYSELLSKVSPGDSAPAADDSAVLDAKHIGALTDEESKVQKLLDLASTKGVAHAVRVARSLRDFYALDRMHDELSGKLYQGLLERGLIEKE